MRICVYGAASPTIDKKYIIETEILGKELATRGHSLVYGAGANGLMGAIARGFSSGKGHILGVIPNFFKEEQIEGVYENCNEITYCETMRERKQIMEDNADAFIIVPGGIGTYEEFFEILTLKQLCRHSKPIAIYNLYGYFDQLNLAIKSAIEKEFIKENCKELYFTSSDKKEIIKYVEAPVKNNYTLKDFKNG